MSHSLTHSSRIFQVKSSLKSSQGLRNFVKSSHDQVKSGQNLVKSSSQVIKSSRLEHPYRCSSQLFSNQVKSQVKSRGRICFKSSHDQVKSGQNFGQVIKSSHQVKWLEHPYWWLHTKIMQVAMDLKLEKKKQVEENLKEGGWWRSKPYVTNPFFKNVV